MTIGLLKQLPKAAKLTRRIFPILVAIEEGRSAKDVIDLSLNGPRVEIPNPSAPPIPILPIKSSFLPEDNDVPIPTNASGKTWGFNFIGKIINWEINTTFGTCFAGVNGETDLEGNP